MSLFKGRQAAQLENDFLRVTVLREGGNIAEVFNKQAGISPLWVPHWTSLEPSTYDPTRHVEFGTGTDARLLAGIMGHNVCLDLFGGPSAEEAAAGFTAHGEGSVNRYEITEAPDELVMQLTLPLAQIAFTRSIKLHGHHIDVHETVENLATIDRPIAWTQHVTLAPPFLDPATTQFRASMTHSMVSENDPGSNAYLEPGAKFVWPFAPRSDHSTADLTRMNVASPASGYTAHLADPQHKDAFFVAYSPQFKLAFGYLWKRADFPWMGIWEENCSRLNAPWHGRTVTRGMEFGVSPFPESRREMVERGVLFDTPTFQWLPSRGRLNAEYQIVSRVSETAPDSLGWQK